MRTTILLLALLASCRSSGQPEIPRRPQLDAEVATQYFYGSPLAGPTGEAARPTLPGRPWTFAVQLGPWPTQSQPGTSPGRPLTEQAALLVDPRRGQPILASTRALRAARWWDRAANAPQEGVEGFGEQVALWPGQTYALSIGPRGSQQQWTMFVHRPMGAARGLSLALAVEEEGETIEWMQWRETWSTESGSRAIGLAQSEAGPSSPGAALVQLHPWSPPPASPQLEAAVQRGTQQAALPHPRPMELPTERQARSRYLSEELDRLRETQDRSVLLSLATELRATRAQDWILTASEQALQTWIAEMGKGVGRLALADQPERFALHLETLALRQAAQTITSSSSSEASVAQARSYLYRHTGQLGAFPDVLLELAPLATSLQDLDDRLAAENHIYLEDSNRSARLRAFEWLKTRGQEPHGYDPLTRSSQRQAALERWRERFDQQAAGESEPGGEQ